MAGKKSTQTTKDKRRDSERASLKKRPSSPPKSAALKKGVAKSPPQKLSAGKTSSPAAKLKSGKKNLTPREERILLIRLNLVRQREALLNEAEAALNELPGQTIFPDLGDQATAETDRNFMLRLRGREQRLLKKIDEAINRIDCGSFGICDDCGNEIELKRLEARPVTTMCIECKTLQEEEEKLREQ